MGWGCSVPGHLPPCVPEGGRGPDRGWTAQSHGRHPGIRAAAALTALAPRGGLGRERPRRRPAAGLSGRGGQFPHAPAQVLIDAFVTGPWTRPEHAQSPSHRPKNPRPARLVRPATPGWTLAPRSVTRGPADAPSDGPPRSSFLFMGEKLQVTAGHASSRSAIAACGSYRAPHEGPGLRVR